MFLLKYKITLAGIIFGALAGFIYWKFVGCMSGYCAITSVWYNSSFYGALIGGLALNIFDTGSKNQDKE